MFVGSFYEGCILFFGIKKVFLPPYFFSALWYRSMWLGEKNEVEGEYLISYNRFYVECLYLWIKFEYFGGFGLQFTTLERCLMGPSLIPAAIEGRPSNLSLVKVSFFSEFCGSVSFMHHFVVAYLWITYLMLSITFSALQTEAS